MSGHHPMRMSPARRGCGPGWCCEGFAVARAGVAEAVAPATVLLSRTLIAAARVISAATLQAAACWRRLRLAGSGATCSGAGMLLSRGQPAEYAGQRGEMRVLPVHPRPPTRRKPLFPAAAAAPRLPQPGARTPAPASLTVR